MKIRHKPAELRGRFFAAFWTQLRIVWPILSGLVGLQVGLGLIVGYLERWSPSAAIYFTFVTGLTIGYGDLVPGRLASRLLAIVIGLTGILLTGLIAALGVAALQDATRDEQD